MNVYDVGDTVRMRSTFRDEDGVLVTPGVVTCTVRKPGGAEEDAVVTADGTGLFHADHNPATAGRYYYRFEGTGSFAGAGEGSFSVREPSVTP